MTRIKKAYLGLVYFIFKQLRKIKINIKVSDREKEYIITILLETNKGREILAKAMVEPIKNELIKIRLEEDTELEEKIVKDMEKSFWVPVENRFEILDL